MKARRMCNKNDDHSAKSTKKKKKKLTTSLISPRPFRRARTKIKKPKFLSLSNTQSQMLSKTPNNSHNNNSTKKQLDLFPVHPDLEQEVPGPDRDPYPDPPENMADHMFSEDGPGPTTLTGLLNGAVSSTTSSGLSYAAAYRAQDSANSARSLVRTAMRRSRERDGTEEERWVSISDVVERRSSTAEEEVTSGGGGAGSGGSSLRLKLDYEEVLNAWSGSGKGPFYVKAEEEEEELPQTVPDLRFEQYGVVPLWGVTSKGPWIVPENSSNGQIGSHSQTGGSTAEGGWKIGLREASVLRYKEKRQSRLFAKRIRYEVRKLNAEKRPRIKGRFVKRGAD
uniref:CCT domain-containing protein n=1 Tax=Opuntia streptacantha TaxID=393608 RepID=A0A7C9FCB8_OPUST